MRVATSLTLPDDLERARSAGELVVFAGAGVSMGPPANLPDFVALAREIAEDAVPFQRRDRNALDRYLGRAQRDAHVKVQERARRVLSERPSAHTPLHEHLMGLFESRGAVRLVTTNFDSHFNAAATQIWGVGKIRGYVGPALPPGREFHGIVQLHGSLDNDDDHLVLTDRDFGSAYMTEGWAARFLVGVFTDRTILFVGYRLGDPVMQYLMRALPPTNRWYALCHERDRAKWQDHGVVPVTFATGRKRDRYSDLNDGVRRWYWYATAPPSDHDGELRRLIALGPPLAPVDEDYVRAQLQTETGRITFWTTATDEAWFAWVAAEGLLRPLVDESANDATLTRWGRWVLDWFCGNEQPTLLRFLRNTSLRVNPAFALEIARYLASARQPPAADTVRQLVAVIVNQSGRVSEQVDEYRWLLDRLVREGQFHQALALLSWMTRVYLEPNDRYQVGSDLGDDSPTELPSLTDRVGINGPPSELIRMLDNDGALLASVLGYDLLELGEQRVDEAYRLIDLAHGAGSAGIDWMSVERTAIGPSNQDQFGAAIDVLVLLIRIVLDHWRENSPENLSSFAESRSAASRVLVRRLGIYALSEWRNASPDAVLDRTTSSGWANDFQVRPELYRLLKAHFGPASEAAKKRFVQTLQNDVSWGETMDTQHQLVRFSLSRLLLRLDPASESTQAFAAAESETHPTWSELDPDGYLTRTESHWGGLAVSPIPAEHLLRWESRDAVGKVLEKLRPTGEFDETNAALVGAVQQAVKTNSHWGVELLIVASGESNPQVVLLLDAILWTLRDSECALPDQLALLSHASIWDWPAAVTHPLGSLFAKWADVHLTDSDLVLLDALDTAGDRIYARARDLESGLLGNATWGDRAFNHPAGSAALIWWQVAQARDRIDGLYVLSIDDKERARWERVLTDDSLGSAFARAILGMVTERLGQGDYPWAARILFPAFNPGASLERAAQLWDGRLMQHTWSRTVVDGLVPVLPAFFQVSASLVPGRSKELGDWVALVVSRWSGTKPELRLLQQFVRHAAPDARKAFADALPVHLVNLTPEARQRLWRDLLQRYWRDRLTNVPVALDATEIAGMIEWVIALPEVADEVLIELEQTGGDAIPHADRIVINWEQDATWLRAHAAEATRLIRWVSVHHSIAPWQAAAAVLELRIAREFGAPPEAVLAAADALGTLPCPEAIALAKELRQTDDSRGE